MERSGEGGYDGSFADWSQPGRLGVTAIDLAQLQAIVSSVDPAAILVSPRLLRRVLRRDRGLMILSRQAARRTFLAVPGSRLQSLLDGDDLDFPRGAGWPETVLLIARPESDELANGDPSALLTQAWRRLFRARIQAEILKKIALGSLDASALDDRIAAIGRDEFEEARLVLRQDGMILPSETDADVYREFASAFLDLTCFAPGLRAHAFPSIEHPDALVEVLSQDVDFWRLFQATRPPGAPDPADRGSLAEHGPEPGDSIDPLRETRLDLETLPEGSPDHRLSQRADDAARRGNDVRSAILHARLARLAGPRAGESSRVAARRSLRQMAERLQKALFVRRGEAELWAEALTPLLRRAVKGFWSPEARLLYDLQKVCVDHEREVSRLDPFGWLFTLGRRPLKRPVPHLREVTTSSHLRSAARRLRTVSLSPEDRARLESLLRPAVRRAEHDLREQFRPWIDATLETTWVRPTNLPERVAYRKLVEELLDRIIARGFTTLGDLRDAASASNLKMPDLAGPTELLTGDPLLQADHALAEALEGVHRRGEIYMRGLQRLSSLAFGTPIGRAVTLFLVLPFGGAFVVLEGLQHTVGLILEHAWHIHVHLTYSWSILLLGLMGLAVVNYVRFRDQCLAALWVLGRWLRTLFVSVPAWVLKNPWLYAAMTSRLVTVSWRLAAKPLLIALPVWAATDLVGLGPADATIAALAVFAAACLVLNTRPGRRLEDAIVDAFVSVWRGLIFSVIPGLFHVIMAAFERFLEWVERVIYAVDEWLRFREGQSRLALAGKALLGAAWGIVAYLVRIYVVILIEPQVNPIKHFPVVTVSHKVILPMSLTITRLFAAPLTPFLGMVASNFIAGTTVLLLPGVFGFLVWELQANWRLYKANRPENLRPIVMGSHGETVVRLLRPGFHSGTIPKLFARLRRAERDGGRDKAILKRRAALHHVEETFRWFIEREVAALLSDCQAMNGRMVKVGSVHLAANRIRWGLILDDDSHPGLVADLVERDGVLGFRVNQDGWVDGLPIEARQAVGTALMGLVAISGAGHASSARGGEFLRVIPEDMSRFVISWQDWVQLWSKGKMQAPSSELDGPSPSGPTDDGSRPGVMSRPGWARDDGR